MDAYCAGVASIQFAVFCNISSVTDSHQLTFGPSWLAPRTIIPARFARFGVEFNF